MVHNAHCLYDREQVTSQYVANFEYRKQLRLGKCRNLFEQKLGSREGSFSVASPLLLTLP